MSITERQRTLIRSIERDLNELKRLVAVSGKPQEKEVRETIRKKLLKK